MDQNKSEIKEKIRTFWDNPNHNYDAGHGVNDPAEKEMWRGAMARLLGPNRNIKVLDIGTGTGFLALLLAEMGYSVTGVDWAENKLRKAKDKAKLADISVNFEIQDAETLSYPEDTFDAVVNRHVIWTLADPSAAIRDWARVVRPGGMIIADVPPKKTHSGDHHFGADVGKNLPFYNGAEPEEIVEMFTQAKITGIDILKLEKPSDAGRTTLLVHGKKM